MQFAVIFTVDTPDDVDPVVFSPPGLEQDKIIFDEDDNELWQMTEDDSGFETPDSRPSWEKGHHRKWCGTLTEQQFKDFLAECNLEFTGEGTALGSIGYGFSKALVYGGCDSDEGITEAYVTPVGEDRDIIDLLQRHKQHVPACLMDTKGQRYLIRGVKDKRDRWQAVVDCLKHICV